MTSRNWCGTPWGTMMTSPLAIFRVSPPLMLLPRSSSGAVVLASTASPPVMNVATPLQHVDHVRVFRMDFRLSGFFPPAGVDHVVATVASVEQHCSLGEGFVDFAFLPVGHCRRGVCRSSRWFRTLSSRRWPAVSSWSALAAPLTPTPPTIWPSTVMGMPPISGVKFSSAVITVRPLPLELISSSKKRVGFLNMTAVLGFADGDVGAGRESAVQSLQGHQVAAVVHHCNDAARCL